eukprot:2803013-Pleurochrysis_carterae.AAC.1
MHEHAVVCIDRSQERRASESAQRGACGVAVRVRDRPHARFPKERARVRDRPHARFPKERARRVPHHRDDCAREHR